VENDPFWVIFRSRPNRVLGVGTETLGWRLR